MSGVAPQPRIRARQLGAYVLGRRIGSGGMASVFAARQVGGGVRGATRVVAVKVMATALADDPAARRMFEREAVIATRIEHPNVVRTYEVGEAQGEIFLAMELVQGVTLSALCGYAPGDVPLAIAIRIASDVARGLAAVHALCDASGERLGVVHQDVTPHNVIVGYDGVTKLLDFGVARIVAHDGTRTQTVRGKPSYLAPEQIALERIDARADIYALGAVLFEVVTGTKSSRAPEITGNADVRTLRADVPEPIARVIGKALAIDPGERFATADAMRDALIEARDACGLPKLEESDVASWVRAVAPPPPSIAEIERELAASAGDADDAYRAEVAAVAALPTLAEGGSRARARRPLAIAALVALIALIALGAWRLEARAPAPGLRLHTLAPGQALSTAGARVVLTLDAPKSQAWEGIFFDHITVTARSGSQLAVVCLTPRAEGQRPLVVQAPSPSDPDPCADLHAGAFSGVNGVYPPSTFNDDWDLSTNPWELDFDGVDEGAEIAVEARAIFGGAAAMSAPVGVMRTRGNANASTAFPVVTLAFAAPPDDAFWGSGATRCEAGGALASWLEISTFPTEPDHHVACPRASKGLAFVDALRPVQTPTLGVVGRIPPSTPSGCGDAFGGETDGVVVWKSDLVPAKGCVTLRLTGHFARCAGQPEADAGACATSVRCSPPPTDLVALASDGRVLQTLPISCVPAYPEPVQYALTVDGAAPVALGLRQRRALEPDACFFDLYDFTWQEGCER